MAPKPADSQTLPNKEAALFRTLIKQYEAKAYKKGIKTADAILRKCPDNGETLAMKGLLLNCLDRKGEAYDHVKRGVKANLRSHVCWHVYGLLYRSDREYDEAAKCYKAALRWDPDNLTVLRDLTQLQVQQRDLAGFLESRQRLLDLKPMQRQSWVGLALAHHLAGNHEVAATVIESMEGTAAAGEGGDGGESEGERYERSELLLYRAQILEEGGRAEEALAALEVAEKGGLVRDRIGAAEARGRLLLALGRAAEAEAVYRRLLAINTENHGYQDGLLAALRAQGAADAPADVAAVFAALQAEHPHSVAARRRPLDFLAGGTPAFEAAADAFVRRYLAKGIPSLFSELRPLYADAAKAGSLGTVMARFEEALAAGGAFPEPLAPPPPHGRLPPAEPHSLTWCQLYLAMHADALGDVGTALARVDACLARSPGVLELHTARSKILKHAGDLAGAAAEAEAARKLALSDRYANSQAAKALFRAGRAEAAEATVAMFTRDGDQANNMYDMQATWYEIASGRTYLDAGDRGRALKRFLKVDAHFADFIEDQFDFHGYCLRKQTMRAYVDMLRMEDGLYRHRVYAKAVAGAVAAYLALADDAAAAAAGAGGRGADAAGGMTPEEAKKAAAKKRKEEARRKKEAEAAAAAVAAAAAAAAKKGGAGQGEARKPDLDPDGVQLAATEDPLGEAAKLVRRLEAAAPDRLNTQLLAFEVYLRKGKLLLALGAAKRAAALGGADHPRAHVATVRLATAAAAAPAPEGPAGAVLREQTAALLGGAADAAAYAADWAARHGAASLPHRLAAAQAAAALAPERAAAAAAELATAGPGDGATHKQAVEAHRWLAGAAAAAAPTAAADFAAAAAKVFRWSRHFGGDLCVELKEEDGGAAGGKANGDAAAAAQGVAALKL